MGSSAEGLVYADPYASCALRIPEVVPYSLRDGEIDSDSEWERHQQ